MQFTLSTCLVLLAAPLSLAVPFQRSSDFEPTAASAFDPTATSVAEPVATSAGMPKGGLGGGLNQIVADHNKYVSDPASAKVPIPASENNAAREGHRQAHAALGPAGRFIPPVR